ncbi:NAD-dependent epimerase/dehydratase family protein [bacterium]|nr:MAG: NAD-dependent epimerase/dehydratase family protein [bacterium]
MAKVFISGVAGFLGSHLADRMIELGHQVVGTDNMIGGYEDNVNPQVEFYSYDCKFRNSMAKITRGCDVVYHCAATPYEGLSVFSPHLITENVYQITLSLISAAIESKVRRFVFCSSMARYGTQERIPFVEDAICRPQDPYGIAKYAAELSIQTLAKVHDYEYVIAVPHNIIGPRQKYDDPYRNVASIMINLMLQGKQPIIYGDGEQKRSFSFIQDDIDCLEKLAFQDNVVGEIINIGPDEEFTTINELAKTIAKLLNFDLKPRYLEDRPMEVKLAGCSAEKARRMLNYRTKYTLERGLVEMIDYIKKRGTRPFRYHLDIEILSDKTPRSWKDKLF